MVTALAIVMLPASSSSTIARVTLTPGWIWAILGVLMELGDVRDVVSRLRETGQLDLAQAIRSLAGHGPAEAGGDGDGNGIAIHLDLPETLAVDDVSRAEILLRCVQAIAEALGTAEGTVKNHFTFSAL